MTLGQPSRTIAVTRFTTPSIWASFRRGINYVAVSMALVMVGAILDIGTNHHAVAQITDKNSAVKNSTAKNSSGLFGSRETRGSSIAGFSKWTDMLSRHAWEEARKDQPFPCRVTANFKCRKDELADVIDAVADRSPREKIEAINSFINDAPYVTDIVNWGIADYWATLQEFLHKDGDCEDFAIAKYFSLKALGLDPDQMRIVVVEDTNLKVPHAVLVVYLDDTVLVLDNQLPQPVKASSILHYRPIYSINEAAWWLHGM